MGDVQEQLPGLETVHEVTDSSAVSQLAVAETVEQTVITKPGNVAFGRFVKPEMYDVFGDYDLGSVTQPEVDWMKPETLGRHLFTEDRDAKFVVNGVALNATEHSIVARSPVKLAEKAEEQTLKNEELNDEQLAKAARSQIHVLDSKQTSMEQHRAKLVEQRNMIGELAKEAKKPGYAHKTEERMKELTSAAWNEFTNILDVVHIQRGWTDETRKRAETTLINYLTQGSQRVRVAHWQAMITLADGYLGARLNVFGNQMRQTQRMVTEKKTAYEQKFDQ